MKPFLLILGALALAGCGSTGSNSSAPASSSSSGSTQSVSSTSGTTTAAALTPANTPRCTTSALAVWLGLGEGNAAAGSTYYPIELTNISGRSCHVFGFPGVSAWNQHQVGAAAQRNRSTTPRTLVLAPGDTAHTLLQITDVANFPSSRCGQVTALGLKVIPPDERTAQGIPFSFPACTRTGVTFLSVQPLQPGVGIPGYPSP
jgi:hypothetical protein